MTPKQIVKHFGGQTAAAKALGLHRSTICQWIRRNEVPRGQQYEIAEKWPTLKVSKRVPK